MNVTFDQEYIETKKTLDSKMGAEIKPKLGLGRATFKNSHFLSF